MKRETFSKRYYISKSLFDESYNFFDFKLTLVLYSTSSEIWIRRIGLR